MDDWVNIALPAAISLISAALGLFGGMFIRLREADSRRWHADRRNVYAQYLQAVLALSRELDSIAIEMPIAPGVPDATRSDKWWEGLVAEKHKNFKHWGTDIQAMLMELQLLGGTKVAAAAERVSVGLLTSMEPLKKGSFYVKYEPYRQALEALIYNLQDLMRKELGITQALNREERRTEGWPWLEGTAPPSLLQFTATSTSTPTSEAVQQESTATAPAEGHPNEPHEPV